MAELQVSGEDILILRESLWRIALWLGRHPRSVRIGVNAKHWLHLDAAWKRSVSKAESRELGSMVREIARSRSASTDTDTIGMIVRQDAVAIGRR
jgi:hypothetical protein